MRHIDFNPQQTVEDPIPIRYEQDEIIVYAKQQRPAHTQVDQHRCVPCFAITKTQIN